MKKILLVTDNRYWREAIGSQKRIAALCRHLEETHDLHVLFLGRPNADDAAKLAERQPAHELDTEPGREVPSAVQTKAASPSLGASLRAVAKQLACNLRRGFQKTTVGRTERRRFSLQIREPKLADFERPQWAARFRAACERIQPDVVLVEYVRLAWLLPIYKRQQPQGLGLIDTHDVQYLRQALFHREGRIHDLDITAAEEAAALSQADAVIAIQSDDARALEQLVPDLPVLQVPHPQAITPLALPGATGGLHLGFFGSSMAPNVDAARHLLKVLWPQIRAIHPDANLHLFGSVCEALADVRNENGIEVRGFVAELAGAYAGLHVVLNPVSYGGGLKIKSVEALCFGRPLVTTPVGAQGMDDGAGTAFAMATDDAGFIAQTLDLLSATQARETMAAAAIAFARTRFSPEHAFDPLDDFLRRS